MTPITHRTTFALGLALSCGLASTLAPASSHREAPFIAGSPKVDGTDFYMFRSYETGRAGFVTIIANYQPLQDSYGGPNYFSMDPEALYEIHIDNNGDAVEDLTFQFRFKNEYGKATAGTTVINGAVNGVSSDDTGTMGERRVQVPLVNLLAGSGAAPGLLNVVETYTVKLVTGPRRSNAGSNVSNVTATAGTAAGALTFNKPIDNIGTKSIPNYEGYADQFIYTIDLPNCAANGKMFVGQRREGFVVNLGQVFDQINLNPLGERNSASNVIADKNVTSLALELPVSCLLAAGSSPEPVIGAWTTASKRQGRLLNPAPTGPRDAGAGMRGPSREGGAWTQVSRLGSPLVNEVVIGITDKDKFNASEPKNDVANFANYVLYPSLPVLVNVLYSVPVPTTPRTADLLPVFVTGIRANVNGSDVDFTHPANVNLTTLAGSGEMLRLNTAFPTGQSALAPAPASDLGFLACDLNGFPNGRRVTDDVVDIALTVAEGALLGLNGLQTCDVSGAVPTVLREGAVVNDGAQPNPAEYQTAFPYLNTPIPGAVSAP